VRRAVFTGARDVAAALLAAARRLFPGAAARVEHPNFGRHVMLVVEFPTGFLRVYAVFVREPFHRFCSYFPRWCAENGRDEALTLNLSVVNRLEELGIGTVYYFLADGRVYAVPVKLFRELGLCRYPRGERHTRVCHVPVSMARLVAHYGKGIPLDAFT